MCTSHDTGRGRKAVPAVCLIVLTVVLLFLIIPAQADAASSYKVEQWGSNSQYFTVYEGTLPPIYGPSFYTESEDVYCNVNTGKNITITFYQPYDSPSQEKAEVLYRYLLSKTSAKYCCCGWYGYTTMISPGNSFTEYYVYKIEGWDTTRDIDDLINSNPYKNERGETLMMLDVGHGDQIQDNWSYIHDILNCCNALYFPVSRPRDGATVGLQFLDENHKYVDKYI